MVRGKFVLQIKFVTADLTPDYLWHYVVPSDEKLGLCHLIPVASAMDR